VAADVLDRIRIVADDVLFPAAIEVDRSGTIPASHWQRLADDGLFGLAAPPDAGGPGMEFSDVVESIEVMAGGCLATTFTWIQHHGPVLRLAMGTTNTALRDELLGDLVAGRVQAGVAFAGVIPDPPVMSATRVDGSWTFTGDAPFVSGWGIVDVLELSGSDVETGDVVSVMIPARPQPGLAVDRIELVAADASNTVRLRADDLMVGDERVTGQVTREAFTANLLFGTRLNGSLALGLIRRCCRLLDEGGSTDAAARFRESADEARSALDAAMGDREQLILARAATSHLAVRAASALVAAGGGSSLSRDRHAQRLAREAVFTLVAAGRPELRTALVDRFSDPER
jgi:alkylation response protein AidB-like acyl-CoA dehydrogenase